jgi:acyl-CoA reductase-like NAD-dependent aldehyde dehydrogenase
LTTLWQRHPSSAVADELNNAQSMPALSGGPFKQHVEFEPRGVVAFISAWNFPILMGVDQMVPC